MSTISGGNSLSVPAQSPALTYIVLGMLIHGQSRRGRRTRIYRIWRDIVTRCTNPNQQQYRDYGGRGIKVCEAWRNSFEVFRDEVLAEIGAPPFAGALFGRINPEKGYEPGNIRWATRTEQNRLRRTVVGSPEMAAEIREVYRPEIARKSGLTAQALADEFCVSVFCVRDIARGRSWRASSKPLSNRKRVSMCGGTTELSKQKCRT